MPNRESQFWIKTMDLRINRHLKQKLDTNPVPRRYKHVDTLVQKYVHSVTGDIKWEPVKIILMENEETDSQ